MLVGRGGLNDCWPSTSAAPYNRKLLAANKVQLDESCGDDPTKRRRGDPDNASGPVEGQTARMQYNGG